MHHIIRYAGEAMKDWELSPIAQNSETFLALTARLPSKSTSTIRFLDSCQFLQSSLDAVTKMMSLNYFILSRQLAQWTGSLNKQIFPYSFITDYDVLHTPRQTLPPYDMACRRYIEWNCQCLEDNLKFI